MSKKINFNKEGMSEMIKGMDIVADAVGGTLGPKGRNVYIDHDFYPKVINDGTTIANSIELPDNMQNMGAKIIRNTAGQTNDNAGDGTTTTAVLTQSLIHECLKRPENPITIRNSVREASKKALKMLSGRSRKITVQNIEKVALISSENKLITKMIKDIISKLGPKAIINIEDSKTFGSYYEVVNGYEANCGFCSPYFVNEQKSMRAVYEDIPVFVSEKRISNVIDIQKVFNILAENKKSSCVIVGDDIDESIIGIMVQNKIRGIFNSIVIRATGETLKDIAGITGANAVCEGLGVTFDNFTLEDFGFAEKVISDSRKTIFVGNEKVAKTYSFELENQAENEQNAYTKNKKKEQAAKVRSGIGIIKIGAPTDFERENLKYKAEDAVKASLSALEEGIVEGGGMTLYRISEKMANKSIGEQILKSVLKSPLKKIIENSGKEYADIIKRLPIDQGYDAKNDKFVNMVESGIIDPTKVERCAVENSISAATEFITSFCAITEEQNVEKK